jgi:CRISPR/Cas system CSM-associated protein Csm4 (group 5 of RAMP superfamily)
VKPTISVFPSENKEISRVSRTQQFTLEFLFSFNFNMSENVKKVRNMEYLLEGSIWNSTYKILMRGGSSYLTHFESDRINRF